jgi:hypothetical protein
MWPSNAVTVDLPELPVTPMKIALLLDRARLAL